MGRRFRGFPQIDTAFLEKCSCWLLSIAWFGQPLLK